MTRARDFRELSADELRGKLAELTEERFRLRFRSATEAIENPIRFRALRRDIARIQTVLRERAGG
ncbi:MAG TPA: 50S ribosomal protein L29 [Gemmatimonadales bacterium]|nr:50S ribosomal protein L29 [Gemmatimonadales bacterium]